MSCYHPLYALSIGKNENGKNKLIFIDPNCLDIYSAKYGRFFTKNDVLRLPCGQCVGCRLDYSRQWANRCMMELQYHESSYFVTLTYDDLHVPKNYYSDPATGEAFPSLTLSKRDFQLFMKRLRKHFPDQKIRFFMSGEYGAETFRPHYHAILFGLKLDDLVFYKKSPEGFSYYNSPTITKLWSDPKTNEPYGFAVVAEVTWDTCAYTARYVMKKLKGKEAKFYSDFNLQPEFTLMSRKPGIARQYYDEHQDIYDYDFINISTEKGGLKFRPPRYFDQIFDIENPERLAEIKAIRQKLSSAALEAKLQRTSLSEIDLLSVEENSKQNRIKSLRRNL